jgi:hypothetical protein
LSQTLSPLTKEELVVLFQRQIFRDNPERVLNNFVRVNKIAFLPTKSVVRFLNESGVPRLVTDELKHNFADRLIYRVCQFTPVDGGGRQFTQKLITEMEDVKFVFREAQGSLLRGKTFDPVPAPPDGPSPSEIAENPHNYYVLVMGDITSQGNRKTVTARLFFLARGQPREAITRSLVINNMSNSIESQRQIARQIGRWATTAVENEIR